MKTLKLDSWGKNCTHEEGNKSSTLIEISGR